MNSQATSFSPLGVIVLYYVHVVGSRSPIYEFPYIGYGSAERLSHLEARMKHFLRLLSSSFLVGMVLVVSAAGQTTNGNIQGTVVDPQGASVEAAAVPVRNMATGISGALTQC